jgi:cytochrome b involved in lipid metabolism
MVNFKAARGALSFTGNAVISTDDDHGKTYVNKKTLKEEDFGAINLKVVALEKKVMNTTTTVNETYDCVLSSIAFNLLSSGGKENFCWFTLEKKSDVILRGIDVADFNASSTSSLSDNNNNNKVIELNDYEVAIFRDVRVNARVGEDIIHSFIPYIFSNENERKESYRLLDLLIEVRPLDWLNNVIDDTASSIEIDAIEIEKEVERRFVNRFVSVGEVFEIRNMKIRIVETNTLTIENRIDRVPKYHCFRGIFDVETTIYVTSALRDAKYLEIKNAKKPPSEDELYGVNFCNVLTNDGEIFPVHFNVLRPCVALTKYIRSSANESSVSCSVDIDTVTFDRCLLFMHALRDEEEPPQYDIRVSEQLSVAAKKLQCKPLQDFCELRLGSYLSRLREWRWEEIVKKNTEEAAVLIVIDYMVLDVKVWLPEHPGGDLIIPAQSLNKDATVHFELYHSSKESFLYLKHFYVGELCERDRDLMPKSLAPASSEFLRMLREYTEDFRGPICRKHKKKVFF